MVAEIKAAGDPVSIFDLAPKQTPQGANAATYIDRVAPQFREFEKKRNALYKTPLGEQLDASEQENKPPHAEQLAAIQAILDAFPTFLAALKDAAECTEYESLLNYEAPVSQFLDEVMKRIDKGIPRSLSKFVQWKIATLVAEGKSDEAIELGIEGLRLAQFYDHEPLLINFLVSVAVRGTMFDAINDALRQKGVSEQVRISSIKNWRCRTAAIRF